MIVGFAAAGVRSVVLIVALLGGAVSPGRAETRPVVVGLNAEFGLPNSTSAQAIERGIRVAIDEINRAGGVLDGRPLALVTKDDRSFPARALANVRELLQIPDLVAVYTGRFSPVVLALLPVVHEHKLVVLAPWSSADGVTDNGFAPNYVFRLSLRDSYAMPAILGHAAERGFSRVGLLLLNTAWGRSNLAAAERHVAVTPQVRITGAAWFNWRDPDILERYRGLRAAGAEAVVLVANDEDGANLVNQMARLPAVERVPILSHWGITGGAFVERVRATGALDVVDLTVIQTFSFATADPAMTERVMAVARRLFGVARPEDIDAAVGFAHAYDLTHLLARAIALAGSTERAAIRDALERIVRHRGLVKVYDPPFTPKRHDALMLGDVFMTRYRADGLLAPIAPRPK
jgi:branched-chain amino acid transport system substrate-binding protein